MTENNWDAFERVLTGLPKEYFEGELNKRSETVFVKTICTNNTRGLIDMEETKTRNWWDRVSDDDIEILKYNQIATGLMPAYYRDLMNAIYTNGDSEFFEGKEWKGILNPFGDCASTITYRLRPDWQRPEEKERRKRRKRCAGNMMI